VKISSLLVHNFRNIEQAELQLSPGLNVFWGNNAQGKTSLLEAAYVGISGKSFRSYAPKKDWITNGKSYGSLILNLTDRREFEAKVELCTNDGKKWTSLINGKKASHQQIRSRVPIVAFSPEDHVLIRGSSDERRSFLDDLLTDVCPGYLEALERFHRALKQRNQALKSSDRESIHVWSKLLAESGIEICALRRATWEDFAFRFREVVDGLFAHTPYKLNLKWRSNLNPEEMSSTEAYFQLLESSMTVDLALGWTRRGPHRDDFAIEIDGQDSRAQASQGQARLLALGLKWLHSEWLRRARKEPPVFLIDDFSSELDEERRSTLIGRIRDLEAQVFVSSTDASTVDLEQFSDYTHYYVFKGFFDQKGAVKNDR
jgi:DNA replication and repair protein RecF